ncbi:MAG: hypothetical protein KF861_22160 [Planctomycetaceae bacterium]|nr:hypothetical protein [Planctomycetaceae bacterium]
MASVDFIEELRLRRLAREAYVPANDRSGLHPILLDELARMDAEGVIMPFSPTDDTLLTDDTARVYETSDVPPAPIFGACIVPLMPDLPGWHGPHEIVPPHVAVGSPFDSRRDLHYT